MLPKINNKSFLECNKEDLQMLIDNPDYRENDFIDYKKNFAFLEIPKDKKEEIKYEISEFRSDICSFANAEGGYIIYGITEKEGCAKEIIGVDITYNDFDKFELCLRNHLMPIQPKLPYISFHPIELNNGKSVVIIYVKSDNYVPYTHIVDQKNYKMYKRSGNEKKAMTYMEMKNMFVQSLSLDKEISNYRKERADYYIDKNSYGDGRITPFMLFHIIPETFIDSSYSQKAFVLEKAKGIHFSSLFGEFECATTAMPCVDGLRYLPYDTDRTKSECYVNDTGVIECYLSLKLETQNNKYPNGYIPRKYLWDKIEYTYNQYTKMFQDIGNEGRRFICISFINCNGMVTQNEEFEFFYKGQIDRNIVMCSPITIEKISDDIEKSTAMKKLYIEYLLSIGVKHDEDLTKYIKEVYNA